MRYKRDGWSVEEGLEKGRQPPDWFMEDVEVGPMEVFYIKQFFDLSTERQIGMAIGPIPISKIKEYGRRAELEPDVLMVYEHVIKAMDNAYLEHVQEQSKKKPKR